MFKQTFLSLAISTTLLAVSQPTYANIVSREVIFTSDNAELAETNGFLEFDESSSWLYDGQSAFEITSFNFTSPLGTNYSLSNIIDEGFYPLSIPAFIPSTEQFVILNFDFIEPEDESEFEPEFVLSGAVIFWLQKPGGFTFVEGISLRSNNQYSESYFTFDNDYLNETGSYTVVPEPLTLLGVGTAIGFGAAFKGKVRKKKDNC